MTVLTYSSVSLFSNGMFKWLSFDSIMKLMLDHRLLRAFVAIADSGSFTVAAEQLHMTQSTISQQLGRLERTIGRELIDRRARPARPTPAGERLIGHARRILALEQEARSLLADPAGTASVRIGVPDDIFTPRMAATFADFAAAHREVRLDVTTGLSRDLDRAFRAGELDVIVVKEPAPRADHVATFPEAIGWFESADIAPGDWPDPMPLVAFPAGALYRDDMFERIGQARRRWYIAFTGSTLAGVLTAVEAGLGVSLVPVTAATGFRVRPCKDLEAGPAMVVSLYAWETAGPVAELAQRMIAPLAERYDPPEGGPTTSRIRSST